MLPIPPEQKDYDNYLSFIHQPGKTFVVEKIHPLDVAAMLNTRQVEYVDVLKLSGQLLVIKGKAYFQTTAVPAITKEFI